MSQAQMPQVQGPWWAFEAVCRHGGTGDFLHVPGEAGGDDRGGALTLTYAQAHASIERIAADLSAAGFQPGHRIGLAFDNRPEFFLHFLAINRIGASIVPLNAAMGGEELAYVLSHADVAAVLVRKEYAAHLRSALPPGVPLGICGNAAAAARPPPPGRPSSAQAGEAALLYTSGTTGTPKGCILTQAYFAQIGDLYTGLGGYCELRPGVERLITPLPVTHMNALAVSLMAMLRTGGCLVQLDRFHPSSWWRSVRTSRATCFHYLGVMPAMLLAAPPDPQDDFSGILRFGFGAGVDPRHHAAFERRFGVPLIEAWAMTETGAGAWITANLEPRHVGQRCFGRAPAGLQWRIVKDPSGAAAVAQNGRESETAGESHVDAAPGEPGELWVRRAGADPRGGFFAGYYKDEAATAAAWDGGWFHTGDIVRVDAEGSFFFVDRSKNLIRRSGENIAAIEVETVLLQHADVRACAVTAVADEVRGEEVFAFIVLREGAGKDAQEAARNLQRHCLEALAYFKAPAWFAFLDALPQTASQKLARAELKRLAQRCLAEHSAIDLCAGKKRRRAAPPGPPGEPDAARQDAPGRAI